MNTIQNVTYLKAVLDSIPQPIMVIDKDFSISIMNHAARAALREDLHPEGRLCCYQISHGQDTPCSSRGDPCPVGEVFQTGKPFKTYHRHQVTEAKQILIEVSVSPVFGETGEVLEVVEIMQDVTDKEIAEKLKISEHRLNSLVESAADSIISIDEAGKITRVNKATSRIFGYASTELTGKSVNILMPANIHEIQNKSAQKAAASRDFEVIGKTVELTALRKDGSEFPIDLSLSSWKTGESVSCTAIIRDITDHKRAYQLLQQGRQTLEKEYNELGRIFKLVEVGKREWEKTMDCVADMVILLDNGDKIKRCNKSFVTFISKSYQEILGRDCMKLFMEQGIQLREFTINEIETFCQPTGQWFVINWYPVTGITGDHVDGMVITIHDTTDLKRVTNKLERTNKEIEENRKGLQNALDELSALIQRVETEQKFNIRFSNPILQKCYEAQGCIKTDCPCYGKAAARCWQVAGTHCRGKVQGAFAHKLENCTQCPVFKSAASNPIYQIGEHFNNMMHILEMKNKELEHAYEELKLTQAKILHQEKMASIGQLAAGVAHEINNPMGFISSNLGTLDKYLGKIFEYVRILTDVMASLDRLVDDEKLSDARIRLKIDYVVEDSKKLIAESLEGAERVKTIVQNLKSFSHVDQAETKLADIHECIETTLNIVWNELKYKAIVKKEYGDIPSIQCNPQQLNQVFLNLFVNAAQALEKQGEITIRTWVDGGSIFISVADTGVGISEKNLSKIFEPFFTTKEVGKGTGLGLSITYDLVKKHNGDITVQSEIGKGTIFTVRIPVNAGRKPSQKGETL